ncbi:Syntaxin-121 protein [Spatholobus suberectus]|nr:Syntaxin-121 protein [Spatholobus suberectus]
MTPIVNASISWLRKKLKDSIDNFNSLRQQILSKYKESVQRRYYTSDDTNMSATGVDSFNGTFSACSHVEIFGGRGCQFSVGKEIRHRRKRILSRPEGVRAGHNEYSVAKCHFESSVVLRRKTGRESSACAVQC